MRKRLSLILAAACVFASAPASAHHSFAAEFDEKKDIRLRGMVTKVEFINPHSWIHLDVKDADGRVINWAIEGGSPNALYRFGFTKDALPIGTEIVVEGYQAKDGSNRANGRDITFADGKKLFVGGSNPDEQPNAK